LKTQYSFSFDSIKCIKCKACEIACKQWKGIRAGTIKLRWVEEIVSGAFPDVKRHFTSNSCRHCAQPACLEVCPVQAIVKCQDGVVIVEPEKCNGCQACLQACSFGVPQFSENGLMQKCDMCVDRIENGQIPVCVGTCPTRALRWGNLEELETASMKKQYQ